jgi:hypothetical protein
VSVHAVFDGEVRRWKGDGAWYFVTLPVEVADEIEDAHPARGGFGSVRVSVRIGVSTWATSVFPDSSSQSFVLPVKKAVRTANDIADGDTVRIELTTLT